jgi:hypothetical protein
MTWTLGREMSASSPYWQTRALYRGEYLADLPPHEWILRCYVRLGQRSQAIRYYYDLRAYLRDELGVTPDPHITAFVNTLLTQAQVGA